MVRGCGDDSGLQPQHDGGMNQIPVILLAAGQSSRMGGTDKLMQDVDGIPLLRRSARAALAVGPVFVAVPPAPHARYGAVKGLDVHAVEIPDADEGMNASLRGAMAAIPTEAKAVMVLLADLPELTGNDLEAVAACVTAHPDKLIWRGATENGKPGHPVIFDHKLFSLLSQLKGDEGAQSVVRANSNRVHLHRLPGRNALLDLDTPEDWDEWHRTRPPK